MRWPKGDRIHALQRALRNNLSLEEIQIPRCDKFAEDENVLKSLESDEGRTLGTHAAGDATGNGVLPIGPFEAKLDIT